mgnify:CR=1 FL=1
MRITFISDKSPSKKIEFDGNIQERIIIHNHSIQRTLSGTDHSFHNGYYSTYTVTVDKIDKKHKHLLIDILSCHSSAHLPIAPPESAYLLADG